MHTCAEVGAPTRFRLGDAPDRQPLYKIGCPTKRTGIYSRPIEEEISSNGFWQILGYLDSSNFEFSNAETWPRGKFVLKSFIEQSKWEAAPYRIIPEEYCSEGTMDLSNIADPQWREVMNMSPTLPEIVSEIIYGMVMLYYNVPTIHNQVATKIEEDLYKRVTSLNWSKKASATNDAFEQMADWMNDANREQRIRRFMDCDKEQSIVEGVLKDVAEIFGRLNNPERHNIGSVSRVMTDAIESLKYARQDLEFNSFDVLVSNFEEDKDTFTVKMVCLDPDHY